MVVRRGLSTTTPLPIDILHQKQYDVSEFIYLCACLFRNSSKTAALIELKFLGMFHNWVQIGLG